MIPQNKPKGKLSDTNVIGVEGPDRRDKYMTPMLSPPPRSPKTPEDFRYPHRLGHWRPFGNDYSSEFADKYYYHESFFIFFFAASYSIWLWQYAPDLKLREWARREAFLRTHKREALGLPLIDKNVVDPDRIVLPNEDELVDFEVSM